MHILIVETRVYAGYGLVPAGTAVDWPGALAEQLVAQGFATAATEAEVEAVTKEEPEPRRSGRRSQAGE